MAAPEPIVASPEIGPPRVDSHWYVAQLKPGGFERARRNLHRQDFMTFMPVHEITVPRKGRVTSSLRPLFPGYLFVQVDAHRQRWTTINNTFGVARLVALDGLCPTPVPIDLIQALKQQCDGGENMGPPSGLDVGTTVRIIAGPFAGTVAEIKSLPDRARVCLLLQLMGRAVPTVIAPRNLERLPSYAPGTHVRPA